MSFLLSFNVLAILKLFQRQYIVKDIFLQLNKTNAANSASSSNSSFEYMRLLWRQTKPLFMTPYLCHMSILCAVTFMFCVGGFGLFLW